MVGGQREELVALLWMPRVSRCVVLVISCVPIVDCNIEGRTS